MTLTYNGQVMEISDKKDWAEVANAIRARLLPDVEIPERDEKFEAIMSARKKA